ncbi:MAG: Trk system potassium transporter TrkA [Clostridiales bacterium]|jgi:trk system potassium uptake protein TrkA|nr:Trk system potassium transporter TrkA [Clostridiales bacterium]
MRIIIVGCGKVGCNIAKSLSAEKDTDITIIDNDTEAIEKAQEDLDVMFIKGNGLSENILTSAGAKTADLIICVTAADEANIFCCILAKKLGTVYTVARVRDPEYALESNKLWRDLGIDMVINPEHQTAREISRLLRYPSADGIMTFVGGRVELISFKVTETENFFVGKSVAHIFHNKKTNILLAMVERGDTAFIPDGDFVFESGDTAMVLGRPSDISNFFTMAGKKQEKINDIMIIGGSKIAIYLTELLYRHTSRAEIKIIEKDKDKCNELCEIILEKNPRCLIINGDGTDDDLLLSEDIEQAGAVICLTGRDEENIVTALYSLQMGIKKVVVKINHINQNMVKSINIGSVIIPQNIMANHIVRFVRGIKAGEARGGILTVHRIFDTDEFYVEAAEFFVPPAAKCIDKKLRDMRIKKGILIGCIVRNANIIIPNGDSQIQPSDTVIIISKVKNLYEIDDILA